MAPAGTGTATLGDAARPRSFRLVQPAAVPAAGAPALDPAQRRVVEHPGGPLLVLAGPGTGKTTTIVESVVHLVEHRDVDPAGILVLTFSRRAATELRGRIARRLGRTTREPLALTFHAYALAILRREAVRAGSAPPRVLSGPEHDLEIRRLLAGEVADGGRAWPPALRPALGTRGFAEELRDLLLRAQERGLDEAGLAELGASNGRADWVAAAGFLQRYVQRFAVDVGNPALDYAQLVRRAADLLADEPLLGEERAAREYVFVDEYQDTDPAQERLLAGLAGAGRNLVVVGDPDQSIYAFRGADVGNLERFADRFRGATGEPAPVVALRTCRRSGPVLLAASRRVASRLPAGPQAGRHRELSAVPGLVAGEVSVHLADSAAGEASLVADVLRRAHLVDGVPWSAMAVLVRSPDRILPGLRRALTAAGVPAGVAGSDRPLAAEPGVRPLLLVLQAAVRPETLDEVTALELLSGPLGRADAVEVRRLRRALAAAGGGLEEGTPFAAAVRHPATLAAVPPELRRPVENVARLLELAVAAAREGASAQDVLWALWSASGLAARWERAAAAGGRRGEAADRALDAVLALFDAAARFVERLPGAGPALFLDEIAARELPGDNLAVRPGTSRAVRLLTAHAAKGLEWDVVVLAGVQEDTWPDLRPRGSLLGSEELLDVLAGRAAPGVSRIAAALAEERRLFYVAATRARRRLVVTAVGGRDQDVELRPSRFLAELVPDHDEDAAAQPRPLSLEAVTAELRSVVTDPARAAAVRAEAAERLAELALAGVPGADPRSWQALTAVSTAQALQLSDRPVRVSPSEADMVARCPLRWLLERAVGAASPPGPAQTVGGVVHALASLVQDGMVDSAAVQRRLDEIWHRLDLGSPWYSLAQRTAALTEMDKFLAWHAQNPRELVAVEQAFEVPAGPARLRGRVDRLERDAQGRAVVVDLKTGAHCPDEQELQESPQLTCYQLAVALGAFAALGLHEPGGAEFVQLGKAAPKKRARVQPQPALPPAGEAGPDRALALVAAMVAEMRGPTFRVSRHAGCRTCPVRTSCPLQPEGEQVLR